MKKQNLKSKVQKVFFDDENELEIDIKAKSSKEFNEKRINENNIENKIETTYNTYLESKEDKQTKQLNTVSNFTPGNIKKIKKVVFTDEEWKQILEENNSLKYESHEIILNSLREGINDKLRGKIWILLYDIYSIATKHDENLYYKLVNTKDESLDDLIRKDIERTIMYTYNKNTNSISKINLSHKHNKLFNILKAYAVYDSDVSYVQGTNYIVASLLLNINSERGAFWTFLQIMNTKKWRDIFTHNTPKLMRMLEILREMISNKMPDLYEYFQKINFVEFFPAVFTQFFVTLFSYNCPIEYTNRVIDLFYKDEEKIIFDCLIHILIKQKEFLINLELDDLVPYMRDKMIFNVITLEGFNNALPFS